MADAVLDLDHLGTLFARADNAEAYRFILARRSSGLSTGLLTANPNFASPGIILNIVVPDTEKVASLDLAKSKAMLEANLKNVPRDEEILSFVVGLHVTGTGPVCVAGPVFSQKAAPAAPPKSLGERQYDYFQTFVDQKLEALVGGDFGKAPGYPIQFAVGEGAMNVFGIRSMRGFVPIDAEQWAYDDWMVQVWIEGGEKKCAGYLAAVDPGKFYVESWVRPDKETGQTIHAEQRGSHVQDGHWRFAYGKHDGYPGGNAVELGFWNDVGWPHTNPRFKKTGTNTRVPVEIPAGVRLRDNRRDAADAGEAYGVSRGPGLNMHWGEGLTTSSGKYRTLADFSSNGCQVLKASRTETEWTDFIGRIARAPNNSAYPYTLIDASALVKAHGPVPT